MEDFHERSSYFFFRRSRISERSSISLGPVGGATAVFFILFMGFTTKKNIANAMMTKFTRTVKNVPTLIFPTSPSIAGRVMTNAEKSAFPNAHAIRGMMTSSTSDVVILPNAAPITTPTARSTTFHFIANSLNSLNMLIERKIKNKR